MKTFSKLFAGLVCACLLLNASAQTNFGDMQDFRVSGASISGFYPCTLTNFIFTALSSSMSSTTLMNVPATGVYEVNFILQPSQTSIGTITESIASTNTIGAFSMSSSALTLLSTAPQNYTAFLEATNGGTIKISTTVASLTGTYQLWVLVARKY